MPANLRPKFAGHSPLHTLLSWDVQIVMTIYPYPGGGTITLDFGILDVETYKRGPWQSLHPSHVL